MAVIEANFGLFQVQVERVPGHPVELHQAARGNQIHGSQLVALDALDVS